METAVFNSYRLLGSYEGDAEGDATCNDDYKAESLMQFVLFHISSQCIW